MKAVLNKVDNGYVLLVNNIMYATDNDKLSKQNCDLLFGIIDVEKLAEEEYPKTSSWRLEEEFDPIRKGFIEGFNKAIELNKDKVFTFEDMRKAYVEGYLDEHSFEVVIQYLQQPKQIKVEIEMEDKIALDGQTIIGKEPKLDSEGCLILTKINSKNK